MAFVQVSGAKLVGTYTSNTTVDVSSLGATSAQQFVLVPSPTSAIQTSGFRRYATSGNWTCYLKYQPGTLTLTNGQLTITLPWTNARASTGNPDEGLMNVTLYIPCKVLYVGDIESAS